MGFLLVLNIVGKLLISILNKLGLRLLFCFILIFGINDLVSLFLRFIYIEFFIYMFLIIL